MVDRVTARSQFPDQKKAFAKGNGKGKKPAKVAGFLCVKLTDSRPHTSELDRLKFVNIKKLHILGHFMFFPLA